MGQPGLCTWLSRTPRFFAEASSASIFRDNILREYRQTCFQILTYLWQTRVVRRPPRASQMLTGSRVTWTSFFFGGTHFLEGLRPQRSRCLHSVDVPFQWCKGVNTSRYFSPRLAGKISLSLTMPDCKSWNKIKSRMTRVPQTKPKNSFV